MADTILSLLEPGEYVLNQNAVDKIGKDVLDEINYKEAPRFPNKSIMGDYFNQQPIPQYQDGGSVSYGGYESEKPTLTNLYEMFGVKPNKEYEKRFQDYDPSREGVYRQDYITALDKSQTTGERGMEQLYSETAGAGGFAGSGAVEKARGRGRKSLMEDYLSSEKTLGSTMFKGVRSERETWLKEMGGQLGALQEAEGTEKYKKPGAVYDGPPLGDEDTGPWNPPENPSTGDSYMATNGQEYMWHFRDGWIAAEDFRSNYDFGPQREGAGGP